MSRLLHPRMTAARRKWLEHVEANGLAKRPKSRTGYDCMRLGWTEWNYTTPEGSSISAADARSRFGDRWFDVVANDFTERLTDAGRAALKAARDQQ